MLACMQVPAKARVVKAGVKGEPPEASAGIDLGSSR